MFDKINNGNTNFKMHYGIIAWMLLALGISFISNKSNSRKEAFINSCIYGLIVYGVYNSTNMATIHNWTLPVWIMDNLWGILVCGIVGLLSYKNK